MKIGFIGAGNIARRHAANLRWMEVADVVAVCDMDVRQARALAQPFQAAVHTHPDTLFAQTPDLDAVLLCTPPAVRQSVFEQAARSGIHVFCEKPPAAAMAAAEAIIHLIEDSGILCSVDFHSRYSPVLPIFFDVMADQALSTVQSTHVAGTAFSPAMPSWFFRQERSGGHVMDQAIHTIDLLRCLVGEIAEVHTLANNRAIPVSDEFDIADTTCTLLRFRNGVSGTHLHSWGSRLPRHDLRFIGRDIQLSLHPYAPPRLSGFRWRGGGQREEIAICLEGGRGMGRDRMRADPDSDSPPDPPHFGALEAFLDAVRHGRPELIRSPYVDAARTLAVVLAMNRSAATGLPVYLD